MHKFIKDGRECLLIIVTGKKRIGKSARSIMTIYKNAVNGRKGLIFDVNNEYGNYKIGTQVYKIPLLSHNDILKFSIHPKIEVRRIVPLNEKGLPLNDKETEALLIKCINEFRGGTILIEDLNTVFGDTLPKNFSGRLSNNAHRDADIILHLQSSGRILPKMRQNTNIVRFHYQLDSIDDSKNKLKEEYEIFKIAQLLVDAQYHSGDIRFYVWIDRDEHKIRGAFSKNMFIDAAKEYLKENDSKIIKQIKKTKLTDSPLNYNQAAELELKALIDKYYGN